MKTQNKKLAFKKDSVVELNDNKLNEVNGGSILSYVVSALVVVFVAGVIEGATDEMTK